MSLTFDDGVADSYGFGALSAWTGTDSMSFAYSEVKICQYPSVATGKQGSPNCTTFKNA